jgi:hypothetical protein
VGFLDVAREPTCRLGGEIVVSHGFCPFGNGSGLELGVYVSKGK